MTDVVVNWFAVIASTIVFMVVGMLWYAPPVFGKMWMKAAGFTPEKMEEAKKKGMGKTYGIMFLMALLESYILAHFVAYTGASTVVGGMQTGFWSWLGFVMTTHASTVLFEQKPKTVFWIGMGYQLVCLLIAGSLLAIWR